jgi:hypothetical protein
LPFHTEERNMKGMKGVIVLTTIIAVAAVLGACRRDEEPPLKLGASDVTITVPAN